MYDTEIEKNWWTLVQADVLVCARGGDGALVQRMALVSALWAAGVRAEIMPRPAPSLSEQYAYAQSRGVRAVVILGDRDALSGDVAVRRQSVALRLSATDKSATKIQVTSSSRTRGQP